MTPRFIVAEDDFVINLFLETVLTEAKYAVLATVETAEAAVEQARQHRPDCVLMDIGLSGQLSGLDAALLLRQELNIPVIFITGNSDIIRRDRRVTEIQPLAVWIKPIDDQLILKEIARLFA